MSPNPYIANPPSTRRRIVMVLVALLGVVALVALLIFLKIAQFTAMGEMGEAMLPPPPSIATATVESRNWNQTIESVGTLEAAKGVTLTAELPGRITRINFAGGEKVKQGDILVEQDLTTEKAQLRAARANVELAKVNLDRLNELFRKGVVSKSELDRSSAEYRALLAQSQSAASSVDKKSIIAPFDGTLGIRLVDIGQEVSAGTDIVSLQALDPILANFSLPQSYLPFLTQGLTVRINNDSQPGQELEGKLVAINSLINQLTRNIAVQAQFANDKGTLLPGMFVNGQIETGDVMPAIVVPLTSVKFASFGDSVFVITEPQEEKYEVTPSQKSDASQKQFQVIQQFVKLGRIKGDYVEVVSGLSEGDIVATGGVFKLQNNQRVLVNNEIKLPFSESPTVADK